MERICKKHGKTEHFERKDGTYRCGKCASEWVSANRRNKKQRLVMLHGNACALCGYHTYVGALDFHHKNPKLKKFSLSVKGLSYSWEEIQKEAEKCVLLCKNCHAEVGAGIKKLP